LNAAMKAEPCMKSLLFRLKNRHELPAQRFALEFNKWKEAIYCQSTFSPDFGDASFWQPDPRLFRVTRVVGEYCDNHTSLEGDGSLTGSGSLDLKEIEGFEIKK
jgi:hypothetical protein